jgi:hypothetical protein
MFIERVHMLPRGRQKDGRPVLRGDGRKVQGHGRCRDRARTNDWIWSDWQYADGTRVFQDPNTRVTFIGVTAIYRMR